MIHGDLLGERARTTPDSTALVLVDTGERLTYSELDERAIRCARLWRETLGLAKGDRIGILAHNRVEYLDAFFAAGKTGIALVTLGTRLTAPELEHIVTDSGLRVLLYDGAFTETVAALRDLVDLEHWIALDEPTEPGDRRYAELTAATRHRRLRARALCSRRHLLPALHLGHDGPAEGRRHSPTARSSGTATTRSAAGSCATTTSARSSRRSTTPAA